MKHTGIAARSGSFRSRCAHSRNLAPARVQSLCDYKNGLVLVTGPTGSGKSTTLAALIHHINQTGHEHILTLEDPLEFIHEPNQVHD